MGAEPWDYYVPFEESVQAALDKLRRREFQAGRFRGSELRPATIEEAMENMDADGTGSILDIIRVGDEPDFCAVVPLSEDELTEYFGTTQPTRQMIQDNNDFYENIERGQGIYIVAYQGGKPSELYFAGYSFD